MIRIWRMEVDGCWLLRQCGLALLALVEIAAFVVIMWVSWRGGL